MAKLLVFPKGKELVQVVVDPDWETADADIENNHYPRRIIPSRIEAFKSESSKGAGQPRPDGRSGRRGA